jgi:hypothetical protein
LKSCLQPPTSITCQNKLYCDNKPNPNILNAAIVKLLSHLERGKPLDLPEIELTELMRPDSFTRKVIVTFSSLRPTLLELTQAHTKSLPQLSLTQ